MAKKEQHVEILKWGKFNRQRAGTSTLRKNCSVGYTFKKTSIRMYKGKEREYVVSQRRSNYHHALVCEALKDSSIKPEDKLDFFHNCMAITEWDINAGLNLIGLPMKIAFRDADKQNATPISNPTADIGAQLAAAAEALASSGVAGGAPNLPCHQHEHSEFNKEVVTHMQDNVWKPLGKEQEDCKIEKKNIEEELNNECEHWRDWLQDRGKEKDGAAVCWQNRNTPQYEPHWFHPLSMNPGSPRKLLPPPNIHEAGNKSEWLKKMFKLLPQ